MNRCIIIREHFKRNTVCEKAEEYSGRIDVITRIEQKELDLMNQCIVNTKTLSRKNTDRIRLMIPFPGFVISQF